MQAVPSDADASYQRNCTSWRNIVVRAVRSKSARVWSQQLNNFPKLRTYRTLCDGSVSREPYLMVSRANDVTTQLITGLRTGANDLEIELGRRRAATLAPEQRLCRHCNLNTAETEAHFLLTCPRYHEERHDFITGLATGFGVQWAPLPAEQRLNILLFGRRMPPPLLRIYHSNGAESTDYINLVRTFLRRASSRRKSHLATLAPLPLPSMEHAVPAT